MQGLALTEGQKYKDETLYKNLTLTLPAVQGRHSGRFTCTAKNQAGVATATANLTVVGETVTLCIIHVSFFFIGHL